MFFEEQAARLAVSKEEAKWRGFGLPFPRHDYTAPAEKKARAQAAKQKDKPKKAKVKFS